MAFYQLGILQSLACTEKLWDTHSHDKAPHFLRIISSGSSLQLFLSYFLYFFPLHKLTVKELVRQRKGDYVGPLQMTGEFISCPEGSEDSIISLQQAGLNFERLWHCSLSTFFIQSLLINCHGVLEPSLSKAIHFLCITRIQDIQQQVS